MTGSKPDQKPETPANPNQEGQLTKSKGVSSKVMTAYAESVKELDEVYRRLANA